MPLSLQNRRVGDIIVVKCQGRIVEGAESAVLKQHVGPLLPHDPYIILDLGDVDFIDSSGLGLLVRFLNRTRAADGDLKMCAVPARITEVLRITRLETIFDSHASEADAVTAFYQRPKGDGAPNRFVTDILCVATSEDLVAYVGEFLRQAGYGVLTATNLSDALVLLRASRPKVVVIGADLRATRGTWTADTFNDLVGAHPVVELPADFAGLDPAETAHRLRDRVQAVIGASPPSKSSRSSGT